MIGLGVLIGVLGLLVSLHSFPLSLLVLYLLCCCIFPYNRLSSLVEVIVFDTPTAPSSV